VTLVCFGDLVEILAPVEVRKKPELNMIIGWPDNTSTQSGTLWLFYDIIFQNDRKFGGHLEFLVQMQT